jgi:hypothetical protein
MVLILFSQAGHPGTTTPLPPCAIDGGLEHALDVVKGDPANFLRFHGFGIKESAVVADGTQLARRQASPQAGLCFSRN